MTLVMRCAVGLVVVILLGLLWMYSWNVGSLEAKAHENATSSVSRNEIQDVRRSRDKKVTKSTIENADVSVLFLGNSHTYPIPRLLTEIYRAESPKTKTLFARAPLSGFLAAHAESAATLDMLRLGKWDYIVLQAQKYSSSGRYTYPHDAALKLSKIANDQGTKIIMYPEWSRRSVRDEYIRINKIHDMIAKKTGATVAPIGQSWELALEDLTTKDLYAPDGNHASRLGSYLNACVFYSMLTGERVGKSDKSQTDNVALKHLLGSSKDPKRGTGVVQKSAWKMVKSLEQVPDKADQKK